MDQTTYGVIANIASYWFVFLMLIIIWRAIIWLRKDAHRKAIVQSMLPDAGFIGEWVVMESDVPTVAEGMVLNASRDGWIGSARACDVRVKARGVPVRAARFVLHRDGLHVLPTYRDTVEVDGKMVRREAVLRHGATLAVGGITLQLRLFAGILLTGEVPADQVANGKKKRGRNDGPVELGDGSWIPEEVRGDLPKPNLIIKRHKSRRGPSGT